MFQLQYNIEFKIIVTLFGDFRVLPQLSGLCPCTQAIVLTQEQPCMKMMMVRRERVMVMMVRREK